MTLHDQNSGLFVSGDDWLAKEIARERNMSAWELDGREAARLAHERQCDAQDVRRMHEENCEVRQVATEHARAHRSVVTPVAAPVRVPANAANQRAAKKISNFVVTLIIIFFVILIVNIFGMMSAFADGPFIFLLPIFFFVFTLSIILGTVFNIIKHNKEK